MSPPRLGTVLGVLCLGMFAPAVQAVEIVGRVTNRTTNQPVAGQEVTLLAMRGGMLALDARDTDGAGRFRFVVAANPNENFLVRVAYRGVNYHQPALLTGGDRIEANLDVFDTADDPGGIVLESHVFFLEPHEGHVRVSELYVFNNRSSPPRTYEASLSASSLLTFRTPADAGEDVRAMVAGPGGMPLRQQPQPGDRPGTWTVDYALRPGASRVGFSYTVPLRDNRYEFALSPVPAASPPRIVTPLAGIRLTGAGLEVVEEDTARQERWYALKSGRGSEVKFRIEVDPAAVATAPPSPEAPAGGEAASAEGTVTLIPNPVAEAKWYIVGLTLAVLAFGLYYLYLLPPTGHTPDESKPGSRARC